MGFSYNVYVGPFVRCAYHMESSCDTDHGCNNPECPQNQKPAKGSFCTFCGKKLETILFPRKIMSVFPMDVFRNAGLGDDPMTECHGEGSWDQNLEHWYAPNQSRGQPRDFFVHRNSRLGLIATPNLGDIKYESEWMLRSFAPEISALEKAYDKIEVTWGIIHYAI